TGSSAARGSFNHSCIPLRSLASPCCLSSFSVPCASCVCSPVLRRLKSRPLCLMRLLPRLLNPSSRLPLLLLPPLLHRSPRVHPPRPPQHRLPMLCLSPPSPHQSHKRLRIHLAPPPLYRLQVSRGAAGKTCEPTAQPCTYVHLSSSDPLLNSALASCHCSALHHCIAASLRHGTIAPRLSSHPHTIPFNSPPLLPPHAMPHTVQPNRVRSWRCRRVWWCGDESQAAPRPPLKR
ncbi:unnamed protein product, partial [Closterium sp. NIES-54]